MDIENPENPHEFDLIALERRLAAWRPSAGGLDRDRMLYEAGRAAASADHRVRSWRVATAALILITVGLSALLVRERSQRLALEVSLANASRTINSPHPVEEIASLASPEPVAVETLAPSSYFALTSRLGQSVPDLPSYAEFEPNPQRRIVNPSDRPPQRRPLQPGDLQRVLDL